MGVGLKRRWEDRRTWATVVQEVEKSFSNQKVASSIPCRSVLEQDTEPLIAPDVQCAISVKCKMCIHCKSHICKSEDCIFFILSNYKSDTTLSLHRLKTRGVKLICTDGSLRQSYSLLSAKL